MPQWWNRLKDYLSGDLGFLTDEDGRELRWPRSRAALPVYYTRAVHPDWVREFADAIRAINAEVGARLLMLPDPIGAELAGRMADRNAPPVRGAIVLVTGEGSDLGGRLRDLLVIDEPSFEDGTCLLEYDRRPGGYKAEIYNARIAVPHQLPSGPKARAVALHELGHALGLRHDDSERSVMHPVIGQRVGVLWGADVRRLRRAYV